MKRILISNDDGVHAPGIRALAKALKSLAEVTVMAPVTEQSAASHALTLHHPIRVKEISQGVYAVEGTPTDCVLLAVHECMDHPPDLVVSGVNQGPNMGEDIIYSGTVAAAMEGAILGIPSVAVSLASREYDDFESAARVARQLAKTLLDKTLPERFLINVNVPPLPSSEMRDIRLTRLGNRVYKDTFIKQTDPRGRDYYWIGGGEPSWTPSSESDFAAVSDGYVSVTPLLLDLTDDRRIGILKTLDLNLR
jgi:5'-nucleotidase